MKILNAKIHGYLDHVVVLVFLAAPTVLGLTGIPAMLAYTLAVAHLLLTVVTRFPMGLFRIIPLQIHGLIELVVSTTLIAVPWLFEFAAAPAARNFYIAAGVSILAVCFATDYTSARKSTPVKSKPLSKTR